jgi:N-methylhydantoinase A/acetone carboxylase, beta subunit
MEALRIGFDMSGTSTDVSLIDGKPQIITDAVVSGYPVYIPMLDIHSISSPLSIHTPGGGGYGVKSS